MNTPFEIRIDWSETDALGHINNLAIQKYVQAARINFCERCGLMRGMTEPNVGAIMASTACQYHRPLFYPGHVKVYSKVTSINHTSLQMVHTVYNDAEELVATANDVIVYFDFVNNQKKLLPDVIRQKISEVEAE